MLLSSKKNSDIFQVLTPLLQSPVSPSPRAEAGLMGFKVISSAKAGWEMRMWAHFGVMEGDSAKECVRRFFTSGKRKPEDIFILPRDIFTNVWYPCIIALDICLTIKTKPKMAESRDEKDLLLDDILKLLAPPSAQPLDLLFTWDNTFSCSNYFSQFMPCSWKYPNWCKGAQNSSRKIHGNLIRFS